MGRSRVGSNTSDFNRLFRGDGKFDFDSRVGMDRSRDPLNQIHFRPENNERVILDPVFDAEMQERLSRRNVHRYSDDDDDNEYSDTW